MLDPIKGLEKLLRLKRQALEELQLQLVALQTRHDTCLKKIESHQQDMRQTHCFVANHPLSSQTYSAYLQRLTQEISSFQEEANKIAEEIAHCYDKMRAVFAEKKAYEQAKAQRELEKLARQKKIEHQMFDEIALQKYEKENDL